MNVFTCVLTHVWQPLASWTCAGWLHPQSQGALLGAIQRNLLLNLIMSFPHLLIRLLHFAWVIDNAKCICDTHICLSVCLSLAVFPHYCSDPDVTWGNGRGCPLVAHYWADLQSVHGFCCCDNVARTQNVSECLYLLCAWLLLSLSIFFCLIWFTNIIWALEV